jgi:hypothetical protein
VVATKGKRDFKLLVKAKISSGYWLDVIDLRACNLIMHKGCVESVAKSAAIN